MATQVQTLSLKATLDKETRRVAIPSNLSLINFKVFIAQLFNVPLTAADNVDALIQFHYKDDESDWIKVGTEQEWIEALRIAVAKGLLRVKIAKKKSACSVDPKAILNDLGKDCKKQWETNVAPHLTELSKQCEGLKNDPRTKQVQENVDKFFDELGAFVRKQEKELPQQLTNWFNQICAAVGASPSVAKPQQQQPAAEQAPQPIVVDAPVMYPIVEQQQEQAPVAPQQAQQDLMSSSLADFVVIQNELAAQKPVAEPAPAVQQEQPAPEVAAPVAVPVAAPAEPATVEPYAEASQVLQSMGFTNQKLNQHLLNKFKGDVARALDSLLQLQQHS